MQGFATLAVMAKSWQDTTPDEYELSSKWASDQKIMARGFSALLQRAWLAPKEIMVRLLLHHKFLFLRNH